MQYGRHWRLALAGVLITFYALALWNSPEKKGGGWGAESDYGYQPDPIGTQRFLAELDQPLFSSAGRDAIKKAQGRDTFLYRAAVQAFRERYGRDWVVERQGIGDCVAWAYSHGIWIAASQDWQLGEISEPPLFPCVEAIYGGSRCEARGRSFAGYSDGSYGGAASRWLHDWGVIWRQDYEEKNGGGRVDLLEYSAARSKEWGAHGCGGKGNEWLDAEAKAYPAAHVALVTTFEEAAAAIESGYPVAVCSGVGFSKRLEPGGWSERQGSWAHAMLFCGVRYGDRPGLLCLNSWGPTWNGPRENRWPDDMPAGSFWVDVETVNAMLGGWKDSFAIGGVQGFKWRDISHDNWLGSEK